MGKHVWEGIPDPKRPFVPVEEVPDNQQFNPEELAIMRDLLEKGKLDEDEAEAAKMFLGEFPQEEPGVTPETSGAERPDARLKSEIPAVDEKKGEILAYESIGRRASTEELARLARTQADIREALRSRRGLTKRGWRSSAARNKRETIRKPPAK